MASRMQEVPPGERFSRGDVLQAARDKGVNLRGCIGSELGRDESLARCPLLLVRGGDGMFSWIPKFVVVSSGSWEQLESLAPSVPWHCVTDGVTFFLLNTSTGARVELDYAFSPEALTTGDFSNKIPGGNNVPSSFTHLRELLKGPKACCWTTLSRPCGLSKTPR